jgi:GAF domain-containing protein
MAKLDIVTDSDADPAARAVSFLTELERGLLSCADRASCVERALEAHLRLHGTTLGNAQLLRPDGRILEIVAQRGFGTEFLETFRQVRADDGCACGRALREGRSIVVEDVQREAEFAPFHHVFRNAGVRAVQSTPLVSSRGATIGMMSTHFAAPHRPSEFDMVMTRAGARRVADCLERLADPR